MPKRYLVTAGLPYSNNRLHVGHIGGAYLPADTYVRYLRATGAEVCFVCGSDDNGVAIEIAALQQDTTPQAIASHYHAGQKRDFAALNIAFDVYGGTHQPGYVETHERLSQEFFRRIFDKGYLKKRVSKQLYDTQAQRFLPDRYVRGVCPNCANPEATGDQCDACGNMIDPLLLKNPVSVITPGAPAEVRETAHWYMRLDALQDRLQQWLESKHGQWRPQVLNFTLGQIKQGLPERAMTRDLSWGIPVPLDDPDAAGKVLYVWFDAPIGYVSFTEVLCQERGDGQAYTDWWASEDSAIVHFIGEDNTVFHALTWPAMLMADERFNLPTAVVANNFVNYRVAGEIRKISKRSTPEESPVWVEKFVERFDPDALRYYLTANAPETARTAFDPAEFITRNNSELVATLGNFINRFMSAFVGKVYGGKAPPEWTPGDIDRELLVRGDAALDKAGAFMQAFQFRAALQETMAFAHSCNEYFGKREPWKTKTEDPAACAATIGTCLHAGAYLAVLMHPFMPGAAAKLRRMLAIDEPVRWSAPPPPQPNQPLGAAEILFAKLDADAFDAAEPTA